MSNFKLTETYIKDLYVVETSKTKTNLIDDTAEIYNRKVFNEYGIEKDFLYELEINLKKGVLRGLHFYIEKDSTKLIRASRGEIYCVAVDLRTDQPTFGRYYSILLSEENKKELYIPDKFAYGLLSLSNPSIVNIRTDDNNLDEGKSGIIWNDRELKIEWMLTRAGNISLSKVDQKWPTFEVISKYLNKTIK